jgi:predicted PurR-regulated permease PerM
MDMPTAQDTERTRSGQQIARVALAVGLTLLGLYLLEGFLRALAWAVILAIATWPLYLRTQRRFGAPSGHDSHNVLLPLLFTAGVTLLFVVPLTLAVFQLSHEARHVMAMVVDAREHGMAAPDWLTRLPVGASVATGWWDANLRDPADARALLGRVDRAQITLFGREFGAQLAHRGILFGFTLATLFFLFRDGPRLIAQVRIASRRLFGSQGETLGRQIIASVHGTVDGLVLVGLGVGGILGVGYWLAGAPHPVLLGAFTAVAAMIPLGGPIVLAIASLLVLTTGSTVAAIALFAAGMVVVFVADHAVRPVLIGGATRLPFLWVLLGILGGVESFGLLGLFLGPAIMAALILLWREWTGNVQDGPDTLPHGMT